jgi:TatA/E family protein of Tat protein translocase
MGPLGWQETIFIFILALLIFGPKKLPELGKTIGKAMTEFRRASSELRSTWDREMATLEREQESLKDVASKVENDIHQSVADTPDHSYYDSGYEYGYGAESTASASSPPVSATATEGAEQTATTEGIAETIPPATVAAEVTADPNPAEAESKPVQA